MRGCETMFKQVLSLTLLSEQLLDLCSSLRWSYQLTNVNLRV